MEKRLETGQSIDDLVPTSPTALHQPLSRVEADAEICEASYGGQKHLNNYSNYFFIIIIIIRSQHDSQVNMTCIMYYVTWFHCTQV